MDKDTEKASRIWQNMNDATGENKPFPEQDATSILAIMRAQMNAEDPDEPILCNCCGQYAPSREVNVWGVCSWCI